MTKNEAIEEFKAAIRSPELKAQYGDSPEVRVMKTADRKGLREVLSYYKKGDYGAAFERAERLDTFVKEFITDTVWRHINQ